MDAREAIEKLRKLLRRAEGKFPDGQELFTEMSEYLSRIEAASPPSSPSSSPARRKGEHTSYAVEESAGESFLSEYRPGARPLRVPRKLFTTTVGVLAESERPLTAEEIVRATESKTSSLPADWQIRVILRFLRNEKNSLLTRSRSRYSPVDRSTFPKAAQALWKASSKK